MSYALVTDLARNAIMVAMLISAPLLLVALLVEYTANLFRSMPGLVS